MTEFFFEDLATGAAAVGGRGEKPEANLCDSGRRGCAAGSTSQWMGGCDQSSAAGLNHSSGAVLGGRRDGSAATMTGGVRVAALFDVCWCIL